jgi:hypothetical protein
MLTLSHNARRGLRIGGVAALLLVTWFCRAKPEYPVAEGDALFQVRASKPVSRMAAVMVHTPNDVGRMALPADGDDLTDEFGGVTSRPQNPMQDSFTPRAPRVVMPRGRTGSSERGGLLDLNTLDPEVERDRAPGSGGWGWLADDVNASTRDPFERLSNRRSRESERRYFSDDDEETLGRGFRSGNGSENGSYFHRQDRRF